MLIPGPDTRVVELRVHGILGTTPEDLVDSVAAVDVAGDGRGRIVRPADRLRRPAPGPVLKAEGRPLPRTVEGYVWSGLTSGGARKAVWALLFPFSLANMASWMLPPTPEGSRAGAALAGSCRALLRLAALLLTVLLISQLSSVSLDLLAGQCLAPGARCLGVVPDWLRGVPAVRAVIGLLPILIVVFVLKRVATVTWTVDVEPLPDRKAGLGELPGADLVADPDAPALRALHLTAALAATVLLFLGGPGGPAGGGLATMCWGIAVGLVGLSLLGALLFTDPTRASARDHWLCRALGPLTRRLLLAANLVLVVLAVFAQPSPVGDGAGSAATVEVVAVGLASVCVLFAVLLVPTALLARKQWADTPRPLRPWAGGWLAAPALALAVALGGGFGSGIGLVVRAALGAGRLALPGGYGYVSLLWGVVGAVAVVVVGIAAIVLGVRRLADRDVPPEVPLLHADRPADAARAVRAWRLAALARKSPPFVLLGLSGIVGVGAIMAALLRRQQVLPGAIDDHTPIGQAAAWLAGFGVLVLATAAGALLREVYLAARNRDRARHLGRLADLASFWPRQAHPIVPPCYAIKVVPELAARAADHLTEPSTRVVLTGHSQGTLLACVAASRMLASLPSHQTERLGLVAAGSPIQSAYLRAFPGVLGYPGLARLCTALGGRWRSLCRGTDPIGDGVSTWDRQVFHGQLIGVGLVPDAPAGALPAATVSPTGALVLGGDHWLPDPERGPFPGRRWAPGVHRHGHYHSDPEWDRAVACAAGMESPSTTTSQPALFRLPGRTSAVG